MLLGGKVLATQYHDVVLTDGGAQRVHDGLIDACAQVDASQFHTNVRGQPPHRGGAVTPAASSASSFADISSTKDDRDSSAKR